MDNSPLWFQGLITIIALLCLTMVWHERSKDRLSRRATLLILTLGPFSWAAQMWLLQHIDTQNELVSLYLFFCTAAALTCFVLAILVNQSSRISGRDIAQALIWGQFVFPLVLIAFLPNGMMSFIALLSQFYTPPQ